MKVSLRLWTLEPSDRAPTTRSLTRLTRSQVIELDREALGGPIQKYLAEKAGASKVTVPQASQRIVSMLRALAY